MASGLIKAKTIRYGIRKGMTVEDFCEKYECTEDEFRRRLRLLYKHEADKVYREICEAASKSRKKPDTTDEQNDRPESDMFAVAEVVVETVGGTNWQGPDPTCGVKEVVADKIDQLRLEEEELSRCVMDLENEHKRLAGIHRAKINVLREIQDSLDQIEAKFRKYTARYEQVVVESNKVIAQMNEISEKRRTKKATLESIRSEIRELETVAICVYNDGTIAPLDDSLIVKLDDAGFEAALPDLMLEKSCQDLRVKDIQTIARLFRIIKNSQIQLDIVFESEEVELACLMLRDEGKF